ncbi:hypothetical protein [Kitasatospora sp. NPDC056531]|uniref:hypothetical protein n=1 Tax=Kitasatospora sp. NPDC056531 TaxID=3345856 RepID=UPI0036CC618F
MIVSAGCESVAPSNGDATVMPRRRFAMSQPSARVLFTIDLLVSFVFKASSMA